MASGRRDAWDPLPAVAAVIALVMIGLYVDLIARQGGQVAAWFLAGLAVAALGSVYGVARAAPQRRLVLAVSGGVMALLGLLGILSIGCPILGAGVLALVAAARQPDPRATWRSRQRRRQKDAP
ncbi:hypothetical protein [Micromonospora narathiwatensis]|uniref:Uncharacterized protein n=1 Tax=Micromonospora narathiwatensis TaxID=299146 RepID=A0A1A8ZHA5_9ACTN|nr:hypothetical protein [Micromonospora narathiwatensis]SBT43207.1 hypothetical protein GA0070621_1726 [Micromonospora narathiwatensis]